VVLEALDRTADGVSRKYKDAEMNAEIVVGASRMLRCQHRRSDGEMLKGVTLLWQSCCLMSLGLLD
jgi:hypothetical protein